MFCNHKVVEASKGFINCDKNISVGPLGDSHILKMSNWKFYEIKR